MKSNPQLQSLAKFRLYELGLVFVGFLAIFLFSAGGYLDTADAEPSLNTARSLFYNSSFRIHGDHLDGRYYLSFKNGTYLSKMGLLIPLLYLPAVAAADRLGHTEEQRRFWQSVLASSLNQIVSAMIAVLLYLFFRRRETPRYKALLITSIGVLGTLIFPYSKTAHREPLQAFFLLACFVSLPLDDAEDNGTLIPFALGGVCLTLGVLTKLAFGVVFLPVFFYLSYLILIRRPNRLKRALLLFLPSIVGGILWVAFSRNRNGHFIWTQYLLWSLPRQSVLWSRNFFGGFYDQFFSSERGLFWYSPLLILTIFVWFEKFRQGALRSFDRLCIITVLVQGAFYASWLQIGEALGPRFLVVIIPVMLLSLRDLGSTFQKNRESQVFVRGLIAVSILMQGVNVAVKMQEYWTIKQHVYAGSIDPQWISNFKIFAHKCIEHNEHYDFSDYGVDKINGESVDLEKYQTLVGFNFWWAHLMRDSKYSRFLLDRSPHRAIASDPP